MKLLIENTFEKPLMVYSPNFGNLTFPPLKSLSEGTKAYITEDENGVNELCAYPLGKNPTRIPDVPGIIQVTVLPKGLSYWWDGVNPPNPMPFFSPIIIIP